MNPFSKIRIAYLEDMINDPEVQEAVSRGSWEIIKRKGSTKFENSMKARLDASSVGGLGIFSKNLAKLSIRKDPRNAILDLRPGNNGHLYPNDPDCVMFYNGSIDYAFYYIDTPWNNPLEPRMGEIMDWISSNYPAGGERKLRDIIGIE